MADLPVLELIEYTDPYCTWCWGSEPVLRKIEEAYGGRIRIRFTMGGLVAEMSSFYDPRNRIGGPEWYEQVAAHWLDASGRHGMPVDERIFFDLKDSEFSTHPANIAYKSAQFQDEALANRFLRRMKEAAAAERRDIMKLEVQAELAKEVGLDPEVLISRIENGSAKDAFEEDLKECRKRGVRGFPSFLIRDLRSGEELSLNGYSRFAAFKRAFEELAGDGLDPVFPRADKNSILSFIKKYGKAAVREIAEVFELSREDAGDYLDSLVSEGRLEREPAGNGFFYKEHGSKKA